jgi:hypothetical protein
LGEIKYRSLRAKYVYQMPVVRRFVAVDISKTFLSDRKAEKSNRPIMEHIIKGLSRERISAAQQYPPL